LTATTPPEATAAPWALRGRLVGTLTALDQRRPRRIALLGRAALAAHRHITVTSVTTRRRCSSRGRRPMAASEIEGEEFAVSAAGSTPRQCTRRGRTGGAVTTGMVGDDEGLLTEQDVAGRCDTDGPPSSGGRRGAFGPAPPTRTDNDRGPPSGFDAASSDGALVTRAAQSWRNTWPEPGS
jgi:hypothetical protein